jgi:4a-hydroxytetrahydrobiopterin dehydratase
MTREIEPLSDAAVDTALAELKGWRREGVHIVRSWAFGDFDGAMAFINAVADVARALDHHPDLTNVFDRVTLAVTTHDAGGLTSLDVEFARRVNALPTA